MQRAAKKRDISSDRTPLCEVPDGLIHNCLKHGERNICLLRTIVHKRLNIRLGEYAAARSDRIDTLPLLCKRIETDRIRREKRCHMINERSCTACTDAVHALLRRIAEICDLCILAAEFYGRRCLRYETAYRRSAGNDFLDKGQADALGNTHARRACERKGELCIADNFLELSQIFLQGFADLREMACVVLVKDRMLLAENNQLYRR